MLLICVFACATYPDGAELELDANSWLPLSGSELRPQDVHLQAPTGKGKDDGEEAKGKRDDLECVRSGNINLFLTKIL